MAREDLHQSRLSSKGQVTIPVEIRDELGLQAGDHVTYQIVDDGVILRRSRPLDIAFHAALSETLDEWTSPEDDEAFSDL